MAQTFTQGFKELFLTALTDTKSTDVEGVGTVRQEGDKWYRWVQNDESSDALRAGDLVCYDLSQNENMHENVLQPVTADLFHMAGIAMSAIAAGEYGWIQIEGWYDDAYVRNSASNVAIAAGDIGGAANGVDCAVKAIASGGVSANASEGYILLMESRASVSNATITDSGTNATLDVWIHCKDV
ncbi:MAG: hypothetical protein Unbinned400contig1000_15 [Prokaryotic dsDNA virus sp.]|nr:MAG: hypothetical protein Unbinned400contig1000_15 [Prokaryotic dsDNA virus sp.]